MSDPVEFSSADRLMVIAPHPDDESLATGCLIQRAVEAGASVRLVFLTSGDNNPWPQRFIERRWAILAPDRARWGARRRREALAAAAVLGLGPDDVSFLYLPDQGLTAMLLAGSEQPAAQLLEQIEPWEPTLLVSPSPDDLHPDHSAAALFVDAALARWGARGDRVARLEYVVHHRGKKTALNHLASTVHPLPSLRHRKRQAIQAHRSQTRLRPGLLRCADQPEWFSPPTAAGREHPIRALRADRDWIEIECLLESRLGSFGQAWLCLASDSAGVPIRRAVGTLPDAGGEMRIVLREPGDGSILATAPCSRRGRRLRVELPMEALGPMDACYAKIERRHGFLDQAGWMRLPTMIALQRFLSPIADLDPAKTV